MTRTPATAVLTPLAAPPQLIPSRPGWTDWMWPALCVVGACALMGLGHICAGIGLALLGLLAASAASQAQERARFGSAEATICPGVLAFRRRFLFHYRLSVLKRSTVRTRVVFSIRELDTRPPGNDSRPTYRDHLLEAIEGDDMEVDRGGSVDLGHEFLLREETPRRFNLGARPVRWIIQVYLIANGLNVAEDVYELPVTWEQLSCGSQASVGLSGSAPGGEPDTGFSVVLSATPPLYSYFGMLRTLRELRADLSNAEAEALLDAVPVVVLADLERVPAERARLLLKAAGATAEVRRFGELVPERRTEILPIVSEPKPATGDHFPRPSSDPRQPNGAE